MMRIIDKGDAEIAEGKGTKVAVEGEIPPGWEIKETKGQDAT